jgi:photosynthetic reaction center cytochrome c subunit
MKTRLSVRRFYGAVVILAMAVIGLAWNLPNLNAQAPAQPQGQAAAPAGPPPPPPTASEMKGKTAAQFYKKIEVLKDIPATEIHPAMEYTILALGVGCGYCHTIGKFDLDDKREKHVARSMIAMTMALNATVFDGKREITCFSCHRGAAKPAQTLVFPGEKSPTEQTAAEIFPALGVRNITTIDSSMAPSKAPVSVVSGPPPAPKPPASPAAPLPAVEDVFSKYTQALGGMAAIGKITSLVEKGTVEMLVPAPPQPQGTPPVPSAIGTVPAEVDRKLPGKAVVSVQFPGRAPNMMGFDGMIGWHGTPLREDTGGELALLQGFAEFPPALKFKEDHPRVQVDAMEKIGDRDAYRVVGQRPDGSAIDRLYFDAQTGLLLRSYTTMQSVLGAFPEEVNYDDYRDVSGVKVPFTVRLVSAQGNRTYKWAQVDVNTPVADSRFTKPLPPPPPPTPAN